MHCRIIQVQNVQWHRHTLRIPADEPSLPEPLASSAAALAAAVPLCCMASSSTLRFLSQARQASEVCLTLAEYAVFMPLLSLQRVC